jgi:hypothetical protein
MKQWSKPKEWIPSSEVWSIMTWLDKAGGSGRVFPEEKRLYISTFFDI